MTQGFGRSSMSTPPVRADAAARADRDRPETPTSRVVVCGSREWGHASYVWQALFDRLAALPEGCVVIHGDARGVDRVAGSYAEALGFRVIPFPAKWAKHGRAAGPIRNREMLDTQPDLVIAVWDGQSRGTKDTIDEAKRRGIPVEVLP